MEIITGHINIDFDCLASILAAGKLYPQAQMVLPGVIGRDVREFLNLYRDTFDFKLSKEIDIEKVSRLIIVDTHSKSRIGEEFRDIITRPGVDIIVYDHHPHCEDGIEAGVRHIADVGANTTLLVEEIINKNIEISSLEATVFALGIYVDTNCLTFDGTKARDAYALAFLLSRGANLQVIETYLVSHLTPKQQVLIENLAKNLKLIDIKGFKIAVSMVELDDYVDDAAYITRKLLVERDYDSFFSIVRMGNKTYIVGRSIADEINIGHIMSFLDGAGHPGAGSAKTNEKDLGKIFIKLEAILKENISPVTTAKDIMSSPVKTVPDDSTINDVNKIMLRYGHSGLPVVRDGILSGIISRRDIEKARVHGFGNSPVKAYMSKNVVTISPDTPIKEIQHHFIEHNIGRLPVLEDSQLVGIITRTDIIRTLFGENPPGWYKRNYVDNQELNRYRRHNLSDRIDMLPDKVRNILVHAGRTADEDGINIYVVGGFVRDLILGVENLDIDIVVEGDAILFAGKLASLYSAQLTKHEKFHTALIVMEDDFKIDIVTARREYYEYPAALPVVEKGSIKDDLFRRDFTVNSMAIKLNKREFGMLVDFYGGRKDLMSGLIRILYNLSFIEDPTRIFRAIRFEQRYGFKMEDKTLGFAVNAIQSGVLNDVSRERINFEFFALLKEKNILGILDRMSELSILEKIYPEVKYTENVRKTFKNCDEWLTDFQNSLNSMENIDRILLYILILHSNMDALNTLASSEKMRLTREYREEISKLIDARDNTLPHLLRDTGVSSFDIYNALKGLSIEVLFVLYLLNDNTLLRNRVIDYINRLRSIKTSITGKDLKELGIKPGPLFKSILDKVLEEKVNGSITTYEEELELAGKIKDTKENG